MMRVIDRKLPANSYTSFNIQIPKVKLPSRTVRGKLGLKAAVPMSGLVPRFKIPSLGGLRSPKRVM